MHFQDVSNSDLINFINRLDLWRKVSLTFNIVDSDLKHSWAVSCAAHCKILADFFLQLQTTDSE